jgi:hypothetical protein
MQPIRIMNTHHSASQRRPSRAPRKKPLWTLGASLLCLLLAIGYVFLRNSLSPSGQRRSQSGLAHQEAGVTSASLRDPRAHTAQVGATQTRANPLDRLRRMYLASTLVGQTFCSAVINGHCLRVGDSVGPFQLAAIHSRHVILNYEHSPYRLDMRR